MAITLLDVENHEHILQGCCQISLLCEQLELHTYSEQILLEFKMCLACMLTGGTLLENLPLLTSSTEKERVRS